MKNKMKLRYMLYLILLILAVLSTSYFVFSANESFQSDAGITQFGAQIVKRGALSESASSTGTITEIEIKPYTYKEPLYKKIDIFPINKAVFNSCGDFYCAQHNTPYGSSSRPTHLGNAGYNYHHSNQITSHQIWGSIKLTEAQANDYKYIMKLDVPYGKPRVYLDVDVNTGIVRRYLDGIDNGIVSTGSTSNKILRPLGTYIGFRDHENDKEDSSIKIKNTVYTNWVYVPHDVKFDCCTYKNQEIKTAGAGVFSNGAYAFVLAAHKGQYHPNGDYSLDPLQHATWDWLGQGGGSAYQKMGTEFDKYHKDSDKPNVDIRPYGDKAGEETVGTVLGTGEGASFTPDEAGTTYHVGPFEMSDYVRAADYKYTIPAGITYTVLSKESVEENNDDIKNGNVVCIDDDVYITYTTTGEKEIILQDSFTQAQGRDSSLWKPGTKSENDLRGTIIGMELVLSNGTTTKTHTVVDYKNPNDPNLDKIPEPGAKDFYIDIPESLLIDGYDELLDIKFIYQRVHASGAGTWYEGLQETVKFEGWQKDEKSDCTYNCVDCKHTGIDYDHRSAQPSTHYKWCLGSGYCEHGYTLHYHCHNGFSNNYCNCTGTLNAGYVPNPCPGHPAGVPCPGHGSSPTRHEHTSSCDCRPAATPYCEHNYKDGKHEPGNGGTVAGSSNYELCYGTTRCPNHLDENGLGHETCRKFTWKDEAKAGEDKNQDALASAGLLSTEIREYTIRVSVPLKTQMSISKYISKVSHQETGSDTPYFDGSSRKDKSMQDNYNDSVKVERGDLVEYTIEVENKSRFDTEVKMRDVLPQNYKIAYLPGESTGILDDCTLEEIDEDLKNSKWTSIPAKSSRKYIVKIRPIQPDGAHASMHGMYQGALELLTPDNPDEKYTNVVEFLTTNAGRDDISSGEKLYMKYTQWGNNATHGIRKHGNIVNTIENKIIDPNQLKPKQIDSDTYEVKQYNVNIEKYIYDVNHVPDNVAESKLDTTIQAGDTRSVLNNPKTTEAMKSANPVYVEYGDTVIYKIKVYNTTNQYDSSIDRTAKPYWEPDKVYVNIEDTLPNKYKDLKIEVDNGTGAITSTESSSSGGKFTIKNMMVPPDGVTTVTVTLKVDEHTKGTVEENNAKFVDEIRNINKQPGNENNVDDKFCVIKNNPIVDNTSDWYKLNNYNTFIDKYVYKYDEAIAKENVSLKLTDPQEFITNSDGTLKTPRENTNMSKTIFNDGKFDDEVRQVGTGTYTDEYKKNHPVAVDKSEKVQYIIKIVNDAQDHPNTDGVDTGNKPATQVRTTKVKDYMQVGLKQLRVTATMYTDESMTTPCNRYTADGSVSVSSNLVGQEDKNGALCNVYEYTIGNDTILNPGECIAYCVEAEVEMTDLYLYTLANTAKLEILTNINHATDTYEVRNEQYDENIAEQKESTDYLRLKDLVIGGKVWLDFNKNGLIDDTISDYVAQTTDENLFRKDQSKLSTYHNINEDAMMKDITVKLYRVKDNSNQGELVRTTKTDVNGLFTFSRNEGLAYYPTYNHDTADSYSDATIYQRVDKASNKDNFGNYTQASMYYEYYVEYEYDGVIYKATAYSGKDHLKENGGYTNNCTHGFETNTDGYSTSDYEGEKTPGDKHKYEYDSNANEFVSVREDFNTKYEYITYNHAYAISGASEPGSTLDFDKTDHTSQLLVDHDRKMTARSFIEDIAQPNSQEATNYIPLFKYNDADITVPYSRYLKFINLGLELREDVDVSLTKDVYKVKTTIKGQEMEYNFNTNFVINGDVLDENAVNNYKLDKAYGIELYESDYKFRNEQYSSIKAVQEYLAVESELNTEVTYRIRIDNNKAHIDDDLKSPDELSGSYDKKNFEDTDKTNLYVKVDEILDLYDENFIKFTPEMEADPSKATIKVRQLDEATGRFAQTDKEIKIAEAWYYKPDASGTYTYNEDAKIYVENGTTGDKYKKVDLKVSNTAIKGSTNEYINSEKYDTYDGYNKLYISGMGEEKILEDSHLDIFVKYVLDKGNEEITITNNNFEETKTDESATLYGSATPSGTTTLIRSLILKEHTSTPEKGEYGLGTENIAQINLYSVWYAESDKPASLVDKDSNAGNVGINNDKQVDSADNKKIYEDNIYKTGIDITAKGTANLPKDPDDPENPPENPPPTPNNPDIRRFLNGHVWDDSRSEKIENQFVGNGLLHDGTAQNEAKKNELVPIMLNDKTEEQDVDVPSAKVEFVEIIETAADTYYETVPTDVSCDYLQHVRTNSDGYYELYGYTPGKYVVRFTYGDDIEENRNNGIAEQTYDGTQARQDDMYLFNGQDYKSTKYTMKDGEAVLDDSIVLYNPATNEADIDKIIASLEAPKYNDARDDEIRRLEVNGYSEIMDNMMAEILQGKANEKGLTNNSDDNTAEELKALVSNTWMYAETIPFVVRAEKINDDLKAQVTNPIVDDPTYASREQLETQLTNVRTFEIENIDFGIQYRPENAVQLEKEIKEVKMITESNETILDLHFYTDYDNTENGSAKTHYLDTEKSVGLDMIQFISNEYEVNDLVSALISEKDALQGFVYINYDTDIQQGATIEITYEFTAENHGEEDRIAKNLDNIRYQNNTATQALGKTTIEGNIVTGKDNQNGTTNYKANITAANDMIDNLYGKDAQGIFYRTSPKVLTALSGRGDAANTDATGVSTKKLSYYGYYTGYENYTGEVTDFDTVAELKFNKILDYVDKDVVYLDNTKGSETLNKTWSVLDNKYKEYYATIDWARSDTEYVSSISGGTCSQDEIEAYINKKIQELNVKSSFKQSQNSDGLTGTQTIKTEIGNIAGALIDPEGYRYENIVVSTDTGMYTDLYTDGVLQIPDGTNPSVSRFLIPMVSDAETRPDSRGKIDLTVSKTISAETSDDELQYENIAEIVEFTTLTGRRTNFAITIGNVDLRKRNNPADPDTPTTPTTPNKEYPQAVPEPDQSAAEVITLIPPQGLMKRDRVIREAIQIAKTGSQVVGVTIAIAAIAVFVVTFTIRRYKKRRIK